ncbi:hypothetical protein GGR58DRAFT_492668 [Xylaria digitata]|nr:hypothetical protein GGR58DRAFT_492668 [Xylaria digitata]
MFWASQRMATRIEDMAHCLMGFFSVTMPLIYGEGKKAFIRLQEEMIKVSDDQSILAWKVPQSECSGQMFYGLLAGSPAAFKDTGHLIFPFPTKDPSSQPTTIGNGALQVELLVQPPWIISLDDAARLRHMPTGSFMENYRPAVLNCRFSRDGNYFPCIDLWCLDSDSSRFARVNPWSLTERSLESSIVPLRFKYRSISSLPLRTILPHHAKTFFERFLGSTPLDLQLISVSHKPPQSTPFGFYLRFLNDSISTHEGYLVDRWFGDDRVLQRGYHFKGNSQENNCLDTKTRKRGDDIDRSKETTRIVEGLVRIRLADIVQEDTSTSTEYFKGSHSFAEDNRVRVVALALGVNLILNHFLGSNVWEREAWCRIVELKQGM